MSACVRVEIGEGGLRLVSTQYTINDNKQKYVVNLGRFHCI